MSGFVEIVAGNQWGFVLVFGSLTLAMSEWGFRLGKRFAEGKSETWKKQIEGIQTSVLFLLAVLIGFTFSMALDRYDARRKLVLQEANDIGTTYLRSALLPESHRAPVGELLREYVDLRLKYQPLVDDPAALAEGLRRSDKLHGDLWEHARQAALEAPNDITALFVESLNQTIDTHAARVQAMRSRIPPSVWTLLIIVAAWSCFATGYRSGTRGARVAFANVVLPIVLTVIVATIYDFTHPRQGFVGISQQPLVDLRANMHAGAGSQPVAHSFRIVASSYLSMI